MDHSSDERPLAEKLDSTTVGVSAPGDVTAPVPTGLTALLRFHGVVPADEPIGTNVDLGIAPDGFHDEAGIGASGDRGRPLDPDAAAAVLAERFDRVALDRLLSHVDELRAALARIG